MFKIHKLAHIVWTASFNFRVIHINSIIKHKWKIQSFFSLFAVLQLCYNKLTGSIPTQLGNLRRLSVLALQYNQLTGAIPASLGDLQMLTRLDLSFNSFFSSIPLTLVNPPILEVLDVRNNSLTGIVPSGNMILSTDIH